MQERKQNHAKKKQDKFLICKVEIRWKLCKKKKLMPPLWIAYPYMERYSIGWRMGSGEEYRYNIYDWFKTLSPSEQNEYVELFPEPKSWCEFWDEFLERDYDEFRLKKCIIFIMIFQLIFGKKMENRYIILIG